MAEKAVPKNSAQLVDGEGVNGNQMAKESARGGAETMVRAAGLDNEKRKPTPDHMDSGQTAPIRGEQRDTRRGWLKNGNPPGDPTKSPRCGAKTRSGKPCRCPAMKNKHGKYTRCRIHGGASTGPRTPEGKERCRKASWKHGKRSMEFIEQRRAWRRELQMIRLESEIFHRQVREFMKEWRRQRKAEEEEQNTGPFVVALNPTWNAGGKPNGHT